MPDHITIIQYRLVDDLTKSTSKNALTYTQFNTCTTDEAKEVFSEFSETFTELYDKTFPIKSKTLNYKDIRSPWVTDTLLLKIDNRDKLSKAADKNRISKDVFRKYRNKLKT